MEQNYRFCYQENQFYGECLPCTATVFNQFVDDSEVAWKISTRQAVDNAIAEGSSLNVFAEDPVFVKWQQRQLQKTPSFASKDIVHQLMQWATSLKSTLHCFIFAVKGFVAEPKTDKGGNPVLDANGNQVMFRRRKLEGIESLSGLFMFDADHLSIDPREVFERTQVADFPWKVCLGHNTSSGYGLRLVCEARPELGNIADNQICLARDLQLTGVIGSTGKPVVDDSCIDASRISYCPRREDIYFIDEKCLFNF